MSDFNPSYGTSLPNLNNQIRLWRVARKLTQAALEERAGLSHNTVSRIERGSVSPRIDTIDRIAQALDISVEQLQFQQPAQAVSESQSQYGTDDHLVQLTEALNQLPETKRSNLIRTFMALVRMAAGDDDA